MLNKCFIIEFRNSPDTSFEKERLLFWAISKKEGIAFDPALNSYVSRCVAGEDFQTEMDNWNFSNRYSASLTGTSAYITTSSLIFLTIIPTDAVQIGLLAALGPAQPAYNDEACCVNPVYLPVRPRRFSGDGTGKEEEGRGSGGGDRRGVFVSDKWFYSGGDLAVRFGEVELRSSRELLEVGEEGGVEARGEIAEVGDQVIDVFAGASDVGIVEPVRRGSQWLQFGIGLGFRRGRIFGIELFLDFGGRI
ncbi:hypothetical protein M5K25_018433 [Dendrobium thyrsiflorum]|uniref:Uncharacterized protein n=1 Tax=Dendrobium thyrsiflorum TaxID=117978 RepID=A0ABD0UHZ6_DENTH